MFWAALNKWHMKMNNSISMPPFLVFDPWLYCLLSLFLTPNTFMPVSNWQIHFHIRLTGSGFGHLPVTVNVSNWYGPSRFYARTNIRTSSMTHIHKINGRFLMNILCIVLLSALPVNSQWQGVMVNHANVTDYAMCVIVDSIALVITNSSIVSFQIVVCDI